MFFFYVSILRLTGFPAYLHGRGVYITVPTIRLLSGPAHLLIVCGGGALQSTSFSKSTKVVSAMLGDLTCVGI